MIYHMQRAKKNNQPAIARPISSTSHTPTTHATHSEVQSPLAYGANRRLDGFNLRSLAKRFLAVAVVLLVLMAGVSYGLARWYQHTQKGKPYQLGVTFIPSYAEYLGVSPQQTLDAAINDLGVSQFRLVSYWNQIETSPGTYDFSQLDWQFAAIEKAGGTVSLAVGLRQPRWPECHAPSFYDTRRPREPWQPQLQTFIGAVVQRYKSSPSLVSYQLENEFFNRFGECNNFDRERLTAEKALIKRLDPAHPVILSRSNNYAGFALREPLGDINGISLYRRVWDAAVTKQYVTYPFPSWHYAALAGAQKLLKNQDSIIHELQTEPWPPRGQNIRGISLAEQNKSFDADRFASTVAFAKQTGIRHIDLWGTEYWYYRWKVLGDDSVWREARKVYDRDRN